MEQSHHPTRVLPVDQVLIDPDSPHHTLGTFDEEYQLRESIEELGVMSELLVCEAGSGRYLLIDGYRRFVIARDLGFKELACVILPPMGSAARERLRFELQMTHKPLTRAELAGQRRKMREMGITLPDEHE